MGQGEGFKELAAISESLTFRKFHLLRRLSLEYRNFSAILRCELATTDFDPTILAELEFRGVSNIKCQLGGVEAFISGFDVRYIKDRGWEKIRWEAIDYEEGQVRWYSEEFEILRVERAAPGTVLRPGEC
jgi:hypothetical protein